MARRGSARTSRRGRSAPAAQPWAADPAAAGAAESADADGPGSRSASGGTRRQSAAPPEDPEATAKQICLRLLTIRARTRAELATALGRRGIDEDTAGRVLARFGEVGLIDDAAFAESYVHSGHTYQGLGRRALAANLRRRGVDDETVGEAVAAVDPESEEEMARALVRRRIPRTHEARDQDGAGGPDRAAELRVVQRLVGMLARRGYSEGLAYRVVREELHAAGQDAAALDDLDPDTPLG